MTVASTPSRRPGSGIYPMLLLLVYIVTIFVGGAFIGPQLYFLVKHLG